MGVDWPAVDVIVGNPPFLGGGKMRGELGDEYYERLTKFYDGRLPGFADLVCYWFENAREQIENGKAKRAGLLATNSIRGGANREVLKRIKETGDIFMAWSDRDWILDGAAVRVSMVGFDDASENRKLLNSVTVSNINPDLTGGLDLTFAQALSENGRICMWADKKGGPFDIPGHVARDMINIPNQSGVSNSDVLFPRPNGFDVMRRPRDVWIIDFGVHTTIEEARRYELPFQHVEQFVKPSRKKNRITRLREQWWIHREPSAEMRQAIRSRTRFIVTPAVAKFRVYVWYDYRVLPDSQLYVIAREDDYFFGVLHSKLHETWSLRLATWHGDGKKGSRPRYTPTTTFETFPFPWPPGAEDKSHPAYAGISAAAKQLHQERDAWLNPTPSPHPPAPSPKMREGELGTGEPAKDDVKPLPLDGGGVWGGGEKALKDRTLTNLYNALQVFRGRDRIMVKPAAADFAPRLDELHRALDEAVCDAYGWGYAVLEDEEEILRRLLALNLARAGD